MPPFREENMCTQSKPRRSMMQQAHDATMDAVDLGQNIQTNNNNTLAIGRSVTGGSRESSPTSPSNLNRRRRHRGQQTTSTSTSSSSTSRTSKSGHVTNINKINVINNFAMGGSGGDKLLSSPWNVLRIVLAMLIIFWFGAMATLLRGIPSSTESSSSSSSASSSSETKLSKSEMTLKRWKKLSEAVPSNGRLGSSLGESPLAGQDKANEDATIADGKQIEAHSIYELSMFGSKSEKDFQLYTPHAPSCSKALDANDISYTLVSQLSEDRVWMVEHHCKRWGDNPMSIMIFTDRSAEDVKSELVSKGCSSENLTVQTVSKTKYDPQGTEYPVNLLRNMAFSAVKTSHIVYADVDFWPASDLHELLSDISIKEQFASDPKLATVIPVFQMYRRCKEYTDCRDKNIPMMPRDKDGLLKLIRKKQASTFDPTNVGGHGSTKYITWRDQEAGAFVDLPCIKSNRYEPYLAFRYCSELPPFQEGFTGYGKNKMTWVMQLRRAGYLFSQLGGAFLVHYPHLDSKARLEWNKKPKGMEKFHNSPNELSEEGIDWSSFKRARVDALFLDFKEWLEGTVEDDARVPMCLDALNDDLRLWVHSDKQATDDDELAEVEEDEGEDEEDIVEGEEEEAGGEEYTDENEAIEEQR